MRAALRGLRLPVISVQLHPTSWNDLASKTRLSTPFKKILATPLEVVVIVRRYCSPDPEGPKYEQYCRQKLMIHQSFRQVDELLGACDKHSSAYHQFLRCGKVPPSLADDIHRIGELQS